MISLPVLFEDEFLCVVDKPPGIVVNRAQSVQGETVQDWAEERFQGIQSADDSEEYRVFAERSGVAHRIDKETSGCLVIAKSPQVLSELMRQFRERTVHKTYLALVHGKITPAEGEIRAPVGRLPWNRERFGVLPGGRDAVTRYAVLQTFSRQDNSGNIRDSRNLISLVELHPETGRTHQIRVHLKHINHPIVADWQYAGRKTARNDRTWAPRVMLHAAKILFRHPVTGIDLAVEAPIPDDMRAIINTK